MNVCQLRKNLQEVLDSLQHLDEQVPVTYFFCDEQGEVGRGRLIENVNLRAYVPSKVQPPHVELVAWFEPKK